MSPQSIAPVPLQPIDDLTPDKFYAGINAHDLYAREHPRLEA